MMTSRHPDWAVLRARVSGEVLLPGSDAYEWARKSFIARFDEVRPQAVVRCTTTGDIVEVIAFTRGWGIGTALRGGGHSLAGYSTTSGIVIDLSPIDRVDVGDGVVVVGAGARLGDLALRLFEQGLAIPTGTCPSVGIAGLTLGGGIGILGRVYGLTLDRLVGAQVVLADGSVVDCSDDQHRDLFWALRGAGAGNFGVVSSFTFEPIPPPTMSNFHLHWSDADAAAVVAAWQEWSPCGPDELSADLVLSAPAEQDAGPIVEVFSAMIGAHDEAADLLAQFVERVGAAPRWQDCRELSYAETCAFQAEVSAGYDQIDESRRGERRLRQGYRFTKSQFFAQPLPTDLITRLVETLTEQRRSGEARSVGFAPWGAAYNRPSPQATAFAHRDQLFLLDHIVVVDPSAPDAAKQAAQEWVNASWESVREPSSPAVYPCFPDPELDDWGPIYYEEDLRPAQRLSLPTINPAKLKRGGSYGGCVGTDSAAPRVDAYIDGLPDWEQAICREVRDLAHAADPEVAETIKRTNRPYFVLQGTICALLAAKDHVNVFLYDGAVVPDPQGIITGGHENKTARTVAIREGETINAPALTAMFKQIIANNRAGGWRKLKRER